MKKALIVIVITVIIALMWGSHHQAPQHAHSAPASSSAPATVTSGQPSQACADDLSDQVAKYGEKGMITSMTIVTPASCKGMSTAAVGELAREIAANDNDARRIAQDFANSNVTQDFGS